MGFLKGSQTSYKPHLVPFSLILEDVRRCQDHTFFFLSYSSHRVQEESNSDQWAMKHVYTHWRHALQVCQMCLWIQLGIYWTALN